MGIPNAASRMIIPLGAGVVTRIISQYGPETVAGYGVATRIEFFSLAVVNALKSRFPDIRGPKKDDICYATQNRQDAVKKLADQCDVILVVGSPNSSNSNRLREIAEKLGCISYLVDSADNLQREWVESARCIGITAGASAPEILVTQVIEKLKGWGANVAVEFKGIEEKVVFSLPKELRKGGGDSDNL